ncbi:SRPBCC family protein [Streptomyces sp. NPDC018057]|uniref:aromatase/cyclase n=1 Tax=unclassified Streptomyces TaxID=2593676 RepID=UPI0037B2CFD9
MPSQRVHSSQDTVSVDAPAGVVYGLLADAPRWPVFLPSCVHVEQMDFDGTEEQLWVWDVTADHVHASRSRRLLHPLTRSIDFELADPAWPGATSSGTWTVEPDGAARSRVTLRHERPRGGPAEGPDTLDADVRAQLARVREAAERWDRLDELLLSFEDSVRVEGPSELVYDFLYRVQDWTELLPHVEWTSVTEDQPGIQIAALDTCAAATGETVTVETVRLCFPHAGRIVYKETLTPELIAAHSGEWSLVPDATGTTLVSAHRVLLREEAVAPLLGEGACLADARTQVREWLGRDSREALGLAKWHAESPLRRLRRG